MELKEFVTAVKESVQKKIEYSEVAHGEIIFNNNDCQILSQSQLAFELIVSKQDNTSLECKLLVDERENMLPEINGERLGWDRYSYASLLQVENELYRLDPKDNTEHKKYSREGMIKRVLKERWQRADKAEYHIKWANNIYGDHILTNERGVKYKVFLRDFENETGYSDSMDAKLNKLGTTKHLMYAFRKLREDNTLYKRLDKHYPFIEIYCDPLNDYKITWHYPHELPVEEKLLISRYFGKSKSIDDDKSTNFLKFVNEAAKHNLIKIRDEVQDKIERHFEQVMLDELAATHQPDFSLLNAKLFDYQKEGIEFAIFKKAAIIADEMGLGKTIQAIGVALNKKKIFGFEKVLVVCPASIKAQWKKEIERFSSEKALVIQGKPEERALQYKDKEHLFQIVNYETILRDQLEINKAEFDFMILDEAQRAKNYETKTAASLKKINAKHTLVITGTPIENRLIDLFSIISILDPYFLGPLWEFSYQHCLFDSSKHNKINGYYNLQKLKKQLEPILIRREKRKVLEQLPNLQQINIPVNLSPLQADYHASYAKGIAQIIHKKFLTPYDLRRLQILLASMRMVCDSTYLIDEETNESPKLEELKYMLLEKLDIKNSKRKIIIFSEWVKMHKLIAAMLRENGIGFAELNGSIPVKFRGELIRKFETNDDCQVFLSTEAGGTGLNLQVANTVINFELPWNPAKKNQRIGRIDRLGQTSSKLTVINFITRQSIEQQIAAGLIVKQNLFDGVLDESSTTNFVDFSSKGRSQFIEQLEEFVDNIESMAHEETEIIEEQVPEQASHPVAKETEKTPPPIEEKETQEKPETPEPQTSPTNQSQNSETPSINPIEFEQVMNNGLQFISGLFKLSTGKDLGMENQKIEVNKETGEVIMKFKLPI